MKARIKITLKNGVLDPQGKAIQNALASLGFTGVNDVRQGKYIEVDLAETNEGRAREQVERICKELLANTVIENYAYELVQMNDQLRSLSQSPRRAHGALGGARPGAVRAARRPRWRRPSRRPRPRPSRTPQYRYSVALPAGCRHDEGPGTLDAVCSAELDPEKSAEASAATSLVLEVGAEPVADDAGKAARRLAQRYGEAQFKAELPEAVCGESDRARVKIENAKQVLEEARVVYTADVACPEIKFLGLGERRATVQFLITPGLRYRLHGAGAEGGLRAAQAVDRRFLREFPRAALAG